MIDYNEAEKQEKAFGRSVHGRVYFSIFSFTCFLSLFLYFELCYVQIIFICFLDDDDDDEDSDDKEDEDTPLHEQEETLNNGTVIDSLFSNFTLSQGSNAQEDGYNSDGTPFLQSQKSSASSSSKNSTCSSPAPSPSPSSPPARIVHAKTGGNKKAAVPLTPPIDANSFLSQLVILF